MIRRMFASFVAAACVAAVPQAAHADTQVVSIGTLAPAASPWGQVFKVWSQAVSQKSGGTVNLQFFYNGQQGDEAGMVGKMKAGQLDGAAVTAVGLSKIYAPILALQMPGLFRTWSKLDAARDALKTDFEKGAKDAGFSILGWGDVGLAHTMTKGYAIRVPDDIKGRKPYMWRDDVVAPALFQAVGGVTPVPLGIPEVLPNLNTGAIDMVTVPALAAEQLQWSSKLDTMGTDVIGAGIGAVVFSSGRLDQLPADVRSIITDTGAVAASALTKRIRSEDDAAYGRLKGKMTNVTLTPDELTKWDTLFKQVRQRLAQGTFAADLVSRLEALAK